MAAVQSCRKHFTLERGGSGQGGCVEGVVPPVAPQQPGLLPLHPEVIPPKRQAVVDRLRRRIESYRRRQSDCMPRFDQSFNGLCEQNLQDTLQLKQRYLDQKTKRPPKPKDKKQQETIQSSVHVQQKFLKRSAEEHDPGGAADSFEPPLKLQCTTQHGSHQPEGLTKFSVEIVQQLEFTTSAANSQPQQISTNVTVKAHTNTSVKSDIASPKSNSSTTTTNTNSNMGKNVDITNLVECVKQEPNNDFADLEECAAAVEKDGGMGFGGITDLIGDDTNDEIFTSPAFKDLISDITNYPEFNFDFEDKNENDLKVEDLKELPLGDKNMSVNSPLIQNYSPPVFETKSRMPPYSNMDFSKTELSPAAQTLKQMAEQHQHKNQIGLSYNPNNRAPNARSPYPDFPLGDYGSPNSNPNFHKSNQNFPQPDMIKQEMLFQGNDYDMKRKGGIYKQQYSPYGSPSPGSHGSPGYLPRGNAGNNNGPNTGNFSGATPPRPPSGPGGNSSGTTLQMNQSQTMHISHGHNIQVSAGQHLHLSGDLKGNVSIATQQGLHFQQQQNPNNSSSQAQNSHQSAQNNSQQNPLPTQQSNQPNTPGGNQSSQHSSMLPDHMPHQNSMNSMSGNGQQSNTNAGGAGMQSNTGNSGMGLSGPGLSSNMSGMSSGSGVMGGSNMSGPGNMPNHPNMNNNQNMGGGNNIPGSSGIGGNNLGGGMSSNGLGPGGIMGGMNAHHGNMPPGVPAQHMSGQTQLGDSYSMTQSQTINFTQQTLRQRTNGIPSPMGGGPVNMGGSMGSNSMRQMSPMEQQKLLQQQQMLRAQQAAMQQQHMVRPPPPDYKTSAGLMQGIGPRYAGPSGPSPVNMRRIPHQTMPPSGPMMRPHMYMVQQQQHMGARGMYPRQQSPMDSMPQHGSAEWRHMMMAQQQGGNFSPQMRPSFQHQGFNLNSAGMQMAPMQQQPMRNQPGGMGQGQLNQQGPMAQMSSMNQQILMQQQQSLQQGNTQMSMSNIHMQQSQSLTVNNQSMHQQQQSSMNNQQLMGSSNNQQSNNMNHQSNELFDMLGIQADSGLSEQDLLNTFASDSGFNLNDISF